MDTATWAIQENSNKPKAQIPIETSVSVNDGSIR